MPAKELPDKLWRKILEMGVKTSKLSYKDLCCVSISCRRLHRLSCEDSLWYLLISLDFPRQIEATSSSSSSLAKRLYSARFEREKEWKLAAHRRVLLRKESEIAESCRRIREIESLVAEETGRLQAAMSELLNLQKVRQASVALKIWQPEIVYSRQKQIVEQNSVPIEGRLHSLEMEIKLCKQRITGLNRASREVKRRLDLATEELESMKYHPLRDYKSRLSGDQGSNVKRKKLKTSINEKKKKT